FFHFPIFTLASYLPNILFNSSFLNARKTGLPLGVVLFTWQLKRSSTKVVNSLEDSAVPDFTDCCQASERNNFSLLLKDASILKCLYCSSIFSRAAFSFPSGTSAGEPWITKVLFPKGSTR